MYFKIFKQQERLSMKNRNILDITVSGITATRPI